MALWTKVMSLEGDALREVKGLYNEQFPLEVRHTCANWLEDQPWEQIDVENPNHENYATNFLVGLLAECEKKSSTEQMFPVKLKLQECINLLRNMYQYNPMYLVSVVKNIIKRETELVQQAENPHLKLEQSFPLRSDVHRTLAQQFEDLNVRAQYNEDDIRKIQHEQESFIIQCQESVRLNNQYQQLSAQTNGTTQVENLRRIKEQKSLIDSQLTQQVSSLIDRRNQLTEKFYETVNKLMAVQSQVLGSELEKWKRQQQLAGNGAPWDNTLDQIQIWCENLADIIWKSRNQIKRCEALWGHLPLDNFTNSLPNFDQQISQLLSTLVRSTLVVERQPPQVMKTNTRFSATVRLLVGGRLNVHMTPPEVHASIISEAQANQLNHQSDKTVKGNSSGEILNNTGAMEYHQATRQLSINFRNMQLRKIRRTEKKGTESVTEEKFALLFQSHFKVGELSFHVSTLSLPVVVIVHGVQEPNAWATVVWDNAFSEQSRIPFVVPEKVTWGQVAEALNCKFKAAVGRGLSDEHLRFLAGKAIHWQQPEDYNGVLISRSQFMKDSLPNRSFTFWEWFYAILKLTKEHLQPLWNDGAVHGFLSRSQAQTLLLQKPFGTFLLRFSDSELGGITIAWVAEGKGGPPEVFLVQPFTSKDFSIRSLADRIGDFEQLVYLYPDLHKDQIFGKYYTQSKDDTIPTPNGYVKPLLVNTLRFPGSSNDSLPPTPQQAPSPENSGIQDPYSNMSDALNDSFDMDMGEFLEEMPQFCMKELLGFKP